MDRLLLSVLLYIDILPYEKKKKQIYLYRFILSWIKICLNEDHTMRNTTRVLRHCFLDRDAQKGAGLTAIIAMISLIIRLTMLWTYCVLAWWRQLQSKWVYLHRTLSLRTVSVVTRFKTIPQELIISIFIIHVYVHLHICVYVVCIQCMCVCNIHTYSLRWQERLHKVQKCFQDNHLF